MRVQSQCQLFVGLAQAHFVFMREQPKRRIEGSGSKDAT